MAQNAYPLAWPEGWKRTNGRLRAAFKQSRQPLTVAAASERLHRQLGLLNAAHCLLSTNVQVRLDGFPRSSQPEPADPGAAEYFTWRKRRMVLACDHWDRVADNIAAIAAHIDCLRGIERYGVGSLEQAFRGYQQLEDHSAGSGSWRRALGVKDDDPVDLLIAETRYRALAKLLHPDMSGDAARMAQLNAAIAAARKELGVA